MNEVEIKLSILHERKYCILVGNGTTAIYLALIAQNLKNKKIAIGNNVCMNVILPIYFSNNIPIFIDIEKDTLSVSIDKLKNRQVDSLIAVHAYGNICNIKHLESYCKDNNIFLIEDVAVAQGLRFNDRCLGSFGDVSILSFGSGKIIDIDHGGALLTDNKEIYESTLRNLKLLNDFEEYYEKQINLISKKHTKLYNIDFGKSLNRHHDEFKQLCIKNKQCFLYKFDKKHLLILDDTLPNLNNFLNIRKNNANYLLEKFRNSGLKSIEIINAKNSSAFWRFNIFVKDYRDELFSYLLNRNFKVSSWYHSIDILFELRLSNITPLSDWVGDNIINIWVNEEIDENYLDEIYNDIYDFLKGKECQ